MRRDLRLDSYRIFTKGSFHLALAQIFSLHGVYNTNEHQRWLKMCDGKWPPSSCFKSQAFFQAKLSVQSAGLKFDILSYENLSKGSSKRKVQLNQDSLMPETTAKVSGGKNMPASPLVSYVSPPQPYCTPFRIRAEAVVTRRSFFWQRQIFPC